MGGKHERALDLERTLDGDERGFIFLSVKLSSGQEVDVFECFF